MSSLPSSGSIGAAIDYAAGLDRVMGDQAMYLRILGRFRSDYRDKATRLRAALEANDLPLAQRIAHTLKGAAAMIEARALRRLAVDAEQQLRSGATAIPELLDRLDAELARVMAQVETLLQAPAQMDGKAAAEVDAEVTPLGAAELERLCGMLDTGDSAAQDFIEDRQAGLHALLGAPRMARLQAAVAAFDFERALQLLRPGAGSSATCG